MMLAHPLRVLRSNALAAFVAAVVAAGCAVSQPVPSGKPDYRALLDTPDRSEADRVTSLFFYHDTVWLGADRTKMNKAIFNALKPAFT
jgi:hypothetical protein